MTMQLAFETVSADANRLSFQERSRRMGDLTPGSRRWALPHVDDLLFALALTGLLAVGGAQLREAIDYAVSAQPAALTATAAPGTHTPG